MNRKLTNLVQFFYKWIAREFDFDPKPEKAFFLAATIRIINADPVKQFTPNPEPFK